MPRNSQQDEVVKQDLVNFLCLTHEAAAAMVDWATPEAVKAMAQAGDDLREKKTAVREALDNLRQSVRAQIRAAANAPAAVEVIAGQLAKRGDEREERIHPPPKPLVSPLANRGAESASDSSSSTNAGGGDA
jgi:hypothetical protein